MVMVKADGSLCTWECRDCCNEEDLNRKKEKEASDRMSNYNRAMWRGDYSRIPRRFADKTLENFSSNSAQQAKVLVICQKYVENFHDVAKKGTSLVFCGKPGTGKTHLAYGIASALRKLYVTAVVKTAADMTAEVKEAHKSESSDSTPTIVVERYSSFGLLIIDEVGVQVSSEAEKRIFFDIINKRYENMVPTILISNLELPELTKFVGERVMDRMKENGGVVFAFDWESHRR